MGLSKSADFNVNCEHIPNETEIDSKL